MVVVEIPYRFWRFGGIDIGQPFGGSEHHGVALKILFFLEAWVYSCCSL